MKVIKYSNKLDNVLCSDSELVQIATNFQFVEGPVWDAGTNQLLFTDIPNNTIYSWNEKTRAISIVNNELEKPNGLAIDANGDIWVCEHKGQKITVIAKGQIKGTITHFYNKRLNSPNDIVCKSDGSLYFTDPPYGFRDEVLERELSFQGIYRIDPVAMEATLLNDEMVWPNGIAFSPDERKIFVADTMEQKIYEFEVHHDGNLGERREFASMDASIGPGIADGLKVDLEGNLYAAGPGGIWIFSSTGESLGVIQTPEQAANVGWGGADLRTLFVTATKSLYKIKLNIPGYSSFMR
ncbi:SMP-30/gluconolactonase/LRE family protein [Paenibacillus alkalitolerans]|uniref:SMP-30/gluconolactonase/LRE family protein n=1 Tax=Paenibacillus alkalitolerans TaxID=2799335 RepID=UPI0018F69776|nr:SMP-30/gluconolactonase/LRE family protein [Paenibacillus alkalitolerans]